MDGVIPAATYRVQLTSEFGFRDCAAILPYLSSLGVSTLYCSPVVQARTGSTHGYDTTDPTRISAELGGSRGWDGLVRAAQDTGMTILLDIVPNHMAASVENPWWRDVLEHGRISPFAQVFDIDWESPQARLRNRVMLPVLAEPLDQAIANGLLVVDVSAGALVLTYGDTEVPLDVRSWRHVLSPLVAGRSGALPEEFTRIVRSIAAAQSVREKPGSCPDLQYEIRLLLKQKMMAAMGLNGPEDSSNGVLAALVRHAAAHLSPERLRRLLQEQNYVLEYWWQGRHLLNYRRFFDINDLVGVRVEDERVFELTHGLLRELADSRVVCGFRVDHVDGLREPLRYLKRLRSVRIPGGAGGRPRPPYVVVEKILSGDEALPAEWPVQGTSGYDFLNEVAGLFIDATGLVSLQRHYRRTTRTRAVRTKVMYANKRRVLVDSFKPELSRLARTLMSVARWLYPSSALAESQLVNALVVVTAALPVYRTYYSGTGSLSQQDRAYITRALVGAEVRLNRDIDDTAFEVVERALTLDVPQSAPPHVRKAVQEHLLRWQQLSGAAMAKGFEDTTLYQDATLLALNDVGSRSTLGSTPVGKFHRWNEERLRDWPHTMNCTATHDTKRGEDVRARLAVLSEMPDEWAVAVDRWFSILGADHEAGPLMLRVDSAAHLFLLQTIIGAWPDEGDMTGYAGRLADYMVKAAREAKTHSSWLQPDQDYEQALAALIGYALTGNGVPRFQECFAQVIDALRFHGLVNSLAQVVLKATCPGIPDFYQGTELLDLSLVDPDNRRLVDYPARASLLRAIADDGGHSGPRVSELVRNWPDARAKLHVTARALHLRRLYVDVFGRGAYTPLESSGESRDHVCALMRSHRAACVVVVVPLRSRVLAGHGHLPLGEAVWGAEAVVLPSGSPHVFRDVLTGAQVKAQDGRVLVADALGAFPVALLAGTRSGW